MQWGQQIANASLVNYSSLSRGSQIRRRTWEGNMEFHEWVYRLSVYRGDWTNEGDDDEYKG